jgi:hypothetical protein|tara:strand:+ start:665 stop:1588 length:924 start_codon:yes stop_codon:yes gene_type:complete
VNNFVTKIKKSNLPFLDNKQSEIFYHKNTDKIIIWMADEAITTDISNQYEEFFDSLGLTMDDILLFHSNANLNRKGYYFVDYFFMECKGILKNYPNYGKVSYDDTKEKIYSCLNHSENKHRTIVFNELKSRKLLKKGFVSYIDKQIFLPITFETPPSESRNWRWSTILPTLIGKTYFNIVTETHHDIEPDFDSLFITEKLCKALITEPFILVGNTKILEYVRDKGFETYPELFDESYDLIENPEDRLDFVLDEIERVCNMNIEELEKIYKSVLWKIKHNRDLMLNFKDDDFIKPYAINWRDSLNESH